MPFKEYTSSEIRYIAGMGVAELSSVKGKLDVLGIDMKDIETFLDRSEVQLFAELNRKIKVLEHKLSTIRELVKE